MKGTRSERLLLEALALDWLTEVVGDFTSPQCTGRGFTRQFQAHLEVSPLKGNVHPEALMNVLEEVSLEVGSTLQLEWLLAQLQAKAASRHKSAAKWAQLKC